jgi:hypothetical protein
MEHLLFHSSLRHLPSLAKPCACSVRFFRQGSLLRSDERQPRGLDGADGQSPSLAMKGICFFVHRFALPAEQNSNPFEGNPMNAKIAMNVRNKERTIEVAGLAVQS